MHENQNKKPHKNAGDIVPSQFLCFVSVCLTAPERKKKAGWWPVHSVESNNDCIIETKAVKTKIIKPSCISSHSFDGLKTTEHLGKVNFPVRDYGDNL